MGDRRKPQWIKVRCLGCGEYFAGKSPTKVLDRFIGDKHICTRSYR